MPFIINRALVSIAAIWVIAASCITAAASEYVIYQGPVVFNAQNNLYTQVLRITNTSANTFAKVRCYFDEISTGARVFNASGTNNGRVYIDFNGQVKPNELREIIAEFFGPSRLPPTYTLAVEISHLVAPPVLSVATHPGPITVALTGTSGSNYIVLATTNFSSASWIPLVTNPAPFTFVEINSNFSNRFYRGLIAHDLSPPPLLLRRLAFAFKTSRQRL